MQNFENHSTRIHEKLQGLHHAYISKQRNQLSVKGWEGANDVQNFETGEIRLRMFRIEYRLDYLHTRKEVTGGQRILQDYGL
jgi:hypothetical protein